MKKNIIQMDFADDTAHMSEDELFQKHYDALKKLRDDSLIILDNYNVLPKKAKTRCHGSCVQTF